MTAMTYGDLQNKTYGNLQNITYAFEGGTEEITNPPEPTTLSDADIAAIASAVWNYTSKIVTIKSDQAAGFATPTDITNAKNEIIQQGNSSWTTATGFVTDVSALEALLDEVIALLANWEMDGSSLIITVDGSTKNYSITTSEGKIVSVHPAQAQQQNSQQ